MTTPAVQERTGQHEELLALIALLLPRLTRTWKRLGTAQDVLLRTLERVQPGRGAIARIRTAVQQYNREVARFDREAHGLAEKWAAIDLPAAYRDGALPVGPGNRVDAVRRWLSLRVRKPSGYRSR